MEENRASTTVGGELSSELRLSFATMDPARLSTEPRCATSRLSSNLLELPSSLLESVSIHSQTYIDESGYITADILTEELEKKKTVLGCLVAVYLNNLLGRKMGLVMTAVISLVGVLIEITSAVGPSARFAQFVVGKTIAAISMGLAANIVPIYLSETSTASARGFAVNMYQNIQIIGYIVAAGSVYATVERTDASGYMIPIGLQFIAPIIMLIGTPMLPESPRWLVWKG